MAASEKSITERVYKTRWFIIGGILMIAIIVVSLWKFSPPVNDASIVVPTANPTPNILDSTEITDRKKYTEMAVNDLASRRKVNPDQIEVVQVAENTFGNTSLGCPKPGVMYAQVLTPGFIIKLSYLNNTYTYHAGLETVVTCSEVSQ